MGSKKHSVSLNKGKINWNEHGYFIECLAITIIIIPLYSEFTNPAEKEGSGVIPIKGPPT